MASASFFEDFMVLSSSAGNKPIQSKKRKTKLKRNRHYFNIVTRKNR